MSSYSNYQPAPAPWTSSSSYNSRSSDINNDEGFSLDSLLTNWSLPIDAKTKKHLKNVYSLLAATFIAASIGAMAHIKFGLGGALTHFASFALVMAIAATRGSTIGSPVTSIASNRSLLLCLFGFVQGCSVGPLIDLALFIDPAIVFTALALTANVFVCLTLSALYLPRRSTFALGSLLSSGLSGLFWLSILSMFFPSLLFFKIQLFGGLLVFAGYLVFDSQMMIERAERGSLDHDSHIDDAMKLFTDLMAIFVRILVILIQNAAKKDQEEAKKKRSTVRR